ncbi:hypothetical protein Tco_1459492 [Tanacetum coccineum]
MDPSSSVGKTCLGENVIEISSDKAEGHGDWNSPEFQDTVNSGGKKQTKAIVFHKMETKEISDRFVAPLKLCLEREVKHRNKMVKKELIVALRGEIYFVKFIINSEEDDVKPGVVFRRSFLRLTKAIVDFGNETVTIYPELDLFLRGTIECKEGDHDVEPFEGRAYGASECFVPTKTSLDTAESDSDDEEEYAFQRNKFGAPTYGPKPARLWEETMMKPDHQQPNALDNTNKWKRQSSDEEVDNQMGNAKVFLGLIARWMKRKGAHTQRESQICCGQFITKLSRNVRVLSNEVLKSLSALTYCRKLDTTTLRELTDFEG